ncbi:MAG: hypothetical protein QGI83_11340, partial [Candidatus Latescibacteria bacterium]|nr:hypothetical protein [Candidatus Latescibacterota bacterium]
MSEQMVLAGTWPIDRPFRTAVSIPDDFPLEPFTPFAARIDFGSLLAESGTEGRFDRNSVVVTRLVGSGGETIFDHLTSEHFVHEDAGDVSWVVQQPAHRWYHVYFDLLENGPHPPPDRIGLVGHGDVLRYN